MVNQEKNNEFIYNTTILIISFSIGLIHLL